MKKRKILLQIKYLFSISGAWTSAAAMICVSSIILNAVSLAGALILVFRVENKKDFFRFYFKNIFTLPDFTLLKELQEELAGSGSREKMENYLRNIKLSENRFLYSEKIRALQKKVYVKYFKKWFGVECRNNELEALSRYSSPAAAGRDILSMAGVLTKRKLNEYDMQRINFAYRTYIQSLELQIVYFEHNSGAEKYFSRNPKAKKKNVYPLKAVTYCLKSKADTALFLRAHALQRIKVKIEFMKFSNYLKLQTLLLKSE